MYQELQLFEESFKSSPVWGTEGNDMPLPALHVGDIFDHHSLPSVRWWSPPQKDQHFKVMAVKHAFSEFGPGPETNHLMQVLVALDDFDNRQEAELRDAETSLASETRRADFVGELLADIAKKHARALFEAVEQSVIYTMKNSEAHDTGGEATNAWQEAAIILKADGHLFADMVRSDIKSKVAVALEKLSRADRLTMCLARSDLKDWFDSDTWPEKHSDFDPLNDWHEPMDEIEEELCNEVIWACNAAIEEE